jgi:hypothetical protein
MQTDTGARTGRSLMSSARREPHSAPPPFRAAGLGESYSVLDELRGQARDAAKRRYENGPGRARSNHEHLPEDPLRRRKARKVVSAYVSRFAKDEYDALLNVAVDTAVVEFGRVAEQKERLAMENTWLKQQIQVMQQQAIMQRVSRSLRGAEIEPPSHVDSDALASAEHSRAPTEPFPATSHPDLATLPPRSHISLTPPPRAHAYSSEEVSSAPFHSVPELDEEDKGYAGAQEIFPREVPFVKRQAGSPSSFRAPRSGRAEFEVMTDTEEPLTPTTIQLPVPSDDLLKVRKAPTPHLKHAHDVESACTNDPVDTFSFDTGFSSRPLNPLPSEMSTLLDNVLGLDPSPVNMQPEAWHRADIVEDAYRGCSASAPPLTYLPTSA